MSSVAVAAWFLALLLILLATRVPIGAAMLITGIGGYVTLAG